MRAGGQAQPLGRVRFETRGGGTDGRDATQAYRVLRRTPHMETSSLAWAWGRGRRRFFFFPACDGWISMHRPSRALFSSPGPVRRRRALECSSRQFGQRQPFEAVALAVKI